MRWKRMQEILKCNRMGCTLMPMCPCSEPWLLCCLKIHGKYKMTNPIRIEAKKIREGNRTRGSGLY